MVKVEKISKEKEKISFIIQGIDPSISNAIRRSILEIPVLAINTVKFYKNDSALYDEILAHRLGLIPLKTTTKTFTRREKCSCKGKGCLKCTASLSLKDEGPKTVYASQFKAKGLEIVYPDTPIVLLGKDQKLELSAEATLGIGKEHAKFTPGLLWFNAYPEIKEIKPTQEQAKKAVKVPASEFSLIEKGKSKMIPNLIDEIVKSKDKGDKFLQIKSSEEDFIFFVESFGQLKPAEIFVESIKALNDNLQQLEKQVKKFKTK